jgi:hypothetical protein
MKTQYTVALSMIAGAILGGAAVQGVNAQLAAKKHTPSPSWKRLILRPLLILHSASRRHKRVQGVAIFARAAERSLEWRGRLRRRAWQLPNGTASRRRRRFSNRKLGPISARTAPRRSRPFADTRLRQRSEIASLHRAAIRFDLCCGSPGLPRGFHLAGTFDTSNLPTSQ